MKGSSAALGFSQLIVTFSNIQNMGKMVDKNGEPLIISQEAALVQIRFLVDKGRAEYADAAKWLRNFFCMDTK